MALEDIVGGPDFTGDSVLDRVANRIMSDLPPGANGDMVLNRLNRKLAQTSKLDEKPLSNNDKGAPDFSDQGIRADKLPDFSDQGVPVPPEAPATVPQPQQPSLGVTGQAKAFAKGLIRSGPEATAGLVQGTGQLIDSASRVPAGEFNDPLAGSISPEDAAKQKAFDEARTRGGSELRSQAAKIEFNKAPKDRTPEENDIVERAKTSENPLIRAGKYMHAQNERDLPISQQEKESVGGRIGEGLGTVALYGTAAALNPALGIAAGFTGMAATTYGSVYEEAKKHGATDDVAISAATRSALVAGVLGSLPLGAGALNKLPIGGKFADLASGATRSKTVADTVFGRWVNSLVGKVVDSGAAFATAGEAQEAILQQIAKDYDPKAGYTFDQKRLIAELILGAGMGGLHHALQQEPLPPSSNRLTGPPPGPGPSPNTGPGPGPGIGGPNTGTGTPPPGGQTGPGPGPGKPPPGTGTGKGAEFSFHPGPDFSYGGPTQRDTAQREYQKAFGQDPSGLSDGDLNAALMRSKMERLYRTFEPGKDPTGMGDHELYNAVNEHLRDTSSTGHTAKGDTEQEKAQRDAHAQRRDEDASLKAAFGWMTDAQIQMMTPEMRAVWLKRAAGDRSGSAGPEATASEKPAESATEPPKAETPTTSPNDLTGAGQEKKVGDRIMMRIVNTENGAKTDERFPFTVRSIKPDGSAIVEHPVHGKLRAHPDAVLHANFAPDEESPTGTRESPIKATTADDVLKAQPAEPKSPAQAEAENYQHAHVKLEQFGLTGSRSISIETGVGQERKGVDADGKPWSVTMEHGAYGRLKGTKGADGAELDAFIGPHPSSPHVFVIDQHDPATGEFDEHKIMLGYRTPIDALHAYANAYNDGAKDRIGHVTAMGPYRFKQWLKGDTTKPLAPVKRPDSSTHKAEESGQYASPNKALHSTEASNDVPKGSSETTLAGAPDAAEPTSIDTDSAAGTVGQPTQGNTQGRDSYVRQRTMNDERDDAEHAADTAKAIAAEYPNLPPEVSAAAHEIAAEGEHDVDRAVKRAADEQAATILTKPEIDTTFGKGAYDEIRAEAAARDGGAPAPESTDQSKPGESQEDRGAVERVPATGKARGKGEKPAADDTAGKDADTKREAAGGGTPAEAGHEPAAETADDAGVEKASKDMEAALDKIEEAVEAGDREAVLKAAREARKVLAQTPQAIKDEEPDYWKQFDAVIRKMVKPGYVTAKQQFEAEAVAAEPKAPTIKPEDDSDGVSLPVSDSNGGAKPEADASAGEVGRTDAAGEAEGAGSPPTVPADHGGQAEHATEPAGDRGSSEGDDVRVSGRHGEPEEGRAERPVQREARAVTGENYRIEPGALGEERGPKAKATDNVQAIKLAARIMEEQRPATAAEQHQLARYVGWGGLKNAFPDASGNIAKGFEQVAADLKEILTPEEYDTARRSIQYAHYTSEDVINGMWDIAERLGFKGGHVFEPGMGVGHFAGLMPPEVATHTIYNGVEMDHVTARIASLLYPKWGVRQADFTKMPLAENAFDLVIGNPPFADIGIQSDPKYPQKFLLHDYFFAKSLDGVRPGGLLAFVTSAGTMNKRDPGARKYLADRAEFVGAVRLPSNAFKKNAGTEVTTDIIILRKRLPDEAAGDRTWTEVGKVTLPGPDGQPTEGYVNQYFIDHPEMVLGKPDFASKLYKDYYSVKAWDNFDLKAALAVAIAKLPRNVMSEAETPQHKAETDFEGTEKKDGSYYLKDGKLYQQRGGAGYEVERRGKGVEGGKSAAELERIRGLIPIRDALRETFAADLADDADAGKRARAKLNQSYDAFVAKFGPINKADITTRRPNSIQEEAARSEAREEARYAGGHFDEGSFDPSRMIAERKSLSEIARARKAAREDQGEKYREGDFDPELMPLVTTDKRPNIEPFIDDQENYRLRAIEEYDQPTGKAIKGDVFTKNIISKDKKPEIKNINDAMLHVLNQKGSLDLDAVAALVGKSRTQAIEELAERIFQVPGSDAWEPRQKYLSGDVLKKLQLAKAAADKNPIYRRNVAALEAAQPAPLAPSQIGASLGMPWIPKEVISQFGTEALGLDRMSAHYTPALASWSVTGDNTSLAATTTWGTSRRDAIQLVTDALNRQSPKIYDQVDKDKRELNVVATQAAQEKVQAIRDKFNEWIFSDEKRADTLADLYNGKYNNLVTQEFNGDHLTTPGIASDWKWRPHQTRVISRIIEAGNTYMAHAVGAGKTSAMIGAGMEMRRLGLAKKPMYAVPNHMLAQFTKEFYEQYPTARIMVADDRQFHTDRRKQFMANVALSDLDAVIITHSSFGMIPVSDEFSDSVIQHELDEYRRALADLPKGHDNRITRSRIEKQIERLEQRLSGKSNRKRDSVFTFDEMGVDFLFVDEAHLFRKLDFSTQMSNLKGITPEGSGMAWDLYVKTKLLETRNPGRNLVLASGTPITNTMAELYTVQRYLQPQALAERQLQHFDAWAGTFGEHVTALEQDAAGGYAPVTRFARFVNAAELSTMVRQVMDNVTGRQLEQYVVRPKIVGGKRQMNLADKGPALEAYQASLAARMQAMKGRGKPQPGDDIMLKVIGDGRHAAIDLRLVGIEPDPEHPSKLDLLVANVAAIHKRTTVKKFYRPRDGSFDMSAPSDVGPAAQMIFANLGISGTRGFSVPNYIRAELIRRGVPRAEIAFISDYKSHVAKQKLFNDVNEGKIRVLIGSTAKMATGVNAQQRLYAVHNLDPLWYPSDDEQRIGRIVRQGNRNPEIEIHDYSTKGTYDSTMWDMMARKARFIQGFFEGDPSLRSIEDLGEASQYEQAKALTTNDPRLIRLTELQQELERANRRKAAFDNEQYAVRRKRADADSDIARYSARELAIEKDIEQRVPLQGDKFTAKIGRQAYDKRVDFGEALLTAIDKIATKENVGRSLPLGEISGFELEAKVRKIIDEIRVHVDLKRSGGAESNVHVHESGLGAVRSMESILGNFDHDLAYVREKLKTARKFLKDSEGQDKKKFTGGSDMETLASEIRVLQAELSGPKEGEAPAAEVPAVTEPKEDQGALVDEFIAKIQKASDEPGSLSEGEGAYGRTAAPKYVTTGIRLRAGAKPGAIGQAHVLNSGRGNGNEFLVAYNAKGHEVDRAEGDPGNVQIPPKLGALLRTPGADIVAHHNHPSDSSHSPQDIGMMALPGLSGLWVQGHGGNVYRVALTPEAKAMLPKDIDQGYYILRRLADLADGRLLGAIQPAVNAYEVNVDEAGLAHRHLVNEILRRAGIIDYQTNFEIGDFIDRVPGLHGVLESAVISARLEAFGGHDRASNVRRPQPLRHAGDLGAVFDKAELATPVAQQADLGRARQAHDRTKAPRNLSDATGSLSESDNTFKKPGSFDNSINDILRKRLLGRLGDLNMTEARTQLQDKFIRVKKAEESVDTPSNQSAYQAESLYYGRTGQRLESLTEHHIDPLLRDMKARDISLEGMDKFLMARHAVERNAKIAAMYPPGHDFHEAASDPNIVGGSGLSKRQAQDILNAIGPAKIADYKAVAAKVDALNLKTRRALLDGGLIDRDTFDAMNAAYRWYVPLRGFEGTEHEESLRQGAGMNIGGKETKTAFGRKSLAASPLAYSIMQAELAIVRAEKNKVGNTFLKFVRAHPDPDRWTVNRPEIIKRIDKATGLVTTMPNNLTRQADNVFETKVDGKPTYITLKGVDGLNLARALGNMGTANAHALIRTYATLTHTMAKVATSWNPDFMIPNLARDVGEAFINLSAQDQRHFARHFAGHILPAIRGSMLAIAGKTPTPGSKMAKYVAAFHRFDQAGGRIRFFGIDNPDQIETNVNKQLARLQGGPLNTIKDIGDTTAKALEIAGGGIENATRLAAFMAAEQAGFSQADAAMLARNLTVDFNKKGELGPVISSLYMFANAGIQGTARMGRALGHRRVMMAVAALAAASALATLLAIGTGGEDEAGVPLYMKIPHWERDKNLIFMLRNGSFLKLPLPYGFSPFAVLASHATSVLLGHEKPGKAAAAVLDSIISAFNPLGEEGSLISDLIPSALRPFAHITFNLDWTGRPLYPANDPSRGTKPDSSQFFRTNSEFSKEAAKKLNEWSGGSAYSKGAVDVHPGSIDHFLSSYTGGVGRFAKTLVDTIVSGYRDHEWNPEKTPIVRRFYGKVNADSDRAAYYEARQPEKDRQSGVAQARKDMKAGVNTEAAKEFIHDTAKETPQKQIFLNADKQMKLLRKEEDKINAGELAGPEKKAALNDVRERMRAVQNKARAESTKLKSAPPSKADAITIRPQGAP